MLPVYDHHGSLHRMGNDLQLFEEMAGFLRDDGPARLQDIRHSLADADYPRMKHATHSLKGLISNFGAARAVSAAIKLETQIQQRKPPEELEPFISELESAVEELQSALAGYCSKAGTT